MDSVSSLLTILLKAENGEAYIIADYSGKKVVFEILDAVESAEYSKATKACLDSLKLNSLGWTAEYVIKAGIVRILEILKAIF